MTVPPKKTAAKPRSLPSQRPVRGPAVPASQDLSLRFILAVLSQWWRILVPVSLLLLAVSISAVMYWFEPEYRAAAWLQVRGDQPYVAFPTKDQADSDNGRKFVNTQIELLRSPLILSRALSQPEVAQLPELRRRRDPVEWLSKEGLEVTPKGDSELLEVAFTGIDPQGSARLVDAVVNAYFSIRDEKSNAQIQSIILLLEDERTRRAEGIKLLQNEIRQLQAQLIAKEPSLAGSVLHGADVVIGDNPLQLVQENLNQAQINREVLQAQLDAMDVEVDPEQLVPEVLIDRQVDQRPEVQEVIGQLNQKRANLDQIASASAQGKDDPRYARAEQEIAQLEQTLQSLREASRPRIRAEIEALTKLEQNGELDDLRTQLATQQVVEQNLRQTYDAMVKQLGQSGGQTLDLRLKQRDLDRRQEVFDRISDRAAQLATEMYAPRRVDPIQDARVPEVPVESIPWKELLVASLFSLGLPFGICLLWERSVKRVTSIEQLQEGALIPVIGEIARLPARRTRQVADDANETTYELGLFEESVDTLRTGLVLAHDASEIQVLAVSSAVSGEGKSSVASQLAVSLARSSGEPTLLIDGDMRSPDLHRIFQIDLQPGLADILAGGQRIGETINRSWSEQVHILPAGKLTKSPHKLLGGDRFESVLHWARSRYRYIVIDTPPILAASESMVMARAADATLICVMREVSRESHVQLTYRRLADVGANPIGTVLSGVPTRQYARRYGSYVYTKTP